MVENNTLPLIEAMRALCGAGNTDPASVLTKSTDGRRIHHLELPGPDPASGKAPIVLIHGAGGGAANWYRMFAPLSATHRVLAVDLPGFGLTDAQRLSPPLGIQAAQTVKSWLDEIGVTRATIIGTSFGGLAALRFAQHFPARTEKLVLIDTAGAAAGVSPLIRLAKWPIAPLLFAPSRSGTRWLLRNVLVRRRLPHDEEAALVEYLFQSAKRAQRGHFVKALRAFTDGSAQAERLTDEELKGITSHTMIVWGARDRFFPPHQADALQKRMPNAVRVLIEDAGHSPNWEQPEELAAALCAFVNQGT